jgi:hypothetical protein
VKKHNFDQLKFDQVIVSHKKNDVLKLKIVLFEIFGFRQGNINTCYLYNASPSPKKVSTKSHFVTFLAQIKIREK